MDMTLLNMNDPGDSAKESMNRLPPAPVSLEAVGLRRQFMVDLILKHLYLGGEMAVGVLARRLRLPVSVIMPVLDFMRVVRLLEVPQRGSFDADIRFALSDSGRSRAGQALERNRYVGPTPVPWTDYCERVRRQSLARPVVTRERLQQALASVAADDELIDQLGAALNSGRGIYLHGPPGVGKTTLAEHLVRCLGGTVLIPHAVAVGDEIIRVFDPLAHRARPAASLEGGGARLQREPIADERWVVCDTPAVFAGGELTLSMIDLQFDPVDRFYTAPLQMKANGGLFIIDDLGRQRVSAPELLNRWIVPLDRGVDFLSLQSGGKLDVPFDVRLIFSSNLQPSQLDDEAFIRRLGYCIAMGPIAPQAYRELMAHACRREGVAFDEPSARYLIEVLYPRSGLPLLAAHPFDLVGRIGDRARFRGETPRLSEDALDWAWRSLANMQSLRVVEPGVSL